MVVPSHLRPQVELVVDGRFGDVENEEGAARSDHVGPTTVVVTAAVAVVAVVAVVVVTAVVT